jgi:hypothetical protein
VIIRRARLLWLASLLLVTLIAIAWSPASSRSSSAIRPSGRLSPIQVHVGAAIVAVPLLAWHPAASSAAPRAEWTYRDATARTGAFALG